MDGKLLVHSKLIGAMLCSAVSLSWSASVAKAQITDLRWEEVENTLDGFVTSDLLIHFSGSLDGMQLIVELTGGSIFQHPQGGHGPPNGELLPDFPDLAFDTYFAFGSPFSGGRYWPPIVGGGAVNLRGDAKSHFTTEEINATWACHHCFELLLRTDFLVARLTLSDDATGEWRAAGNAGGLSQIFAGPIASGSVGSFRLPGDYNGNDFVEQGDLDLVLLNWGAPAMPTPTQWTSNLPQGTISQNELDYVLLNWGQRSTGSDARAIPEPGTVALMLTAAFTLLTYRTWTRNSAKP